MHSGASRLALLAATSAAARATSLRTRPMRSCNGPCRLRSAFTSCSRGTRRDSNPRTDNTENKPEPTLITHTRHRITFDKLVFLHVLLLLSSPLIPQSLPAAERDEADVIFDFPKPPSNKLIISHSSPAHRRSRHAIACCSQ